MDEPKYKPRKPRKKQDSLLVPRLLWFSVYLSLCFVAFKGMKYFSEPCLHPPPPHGQSVVIPCPLSVLPGHACRHIATATAVL